jgi:hypothetical protein
MSQIPADWIAFFSFLVLFVVAILAEVMWLVRKGGTTSSRAVAFTMITDIVGFGIGFLIVLTAFVIMFMMVMGPAGTGGNAPEYAYWITTAIALIFPPIILILIKRVFLAIFSLRSGGPAWTYSLVSSIFFIAFVPVPPTAFFFLFAYLSSWK